MRGVEVLLTAQEETYGKLILAQIFTHIWYGDWDNYEQTMNQLPERLVNEFPFHACYDRKETKIWHDNYFSIPGIYFVPPYMSSYREKSETAELDTKQDLLCLIGAYEKLGFYYPLEREAFPDHIGSLTAFITATLKEEAVALEKGDHELVIELADARKEMYDKYLAPCLGVICKQHQHKFSDSFFNMFIPFYMEEIKGIAHK